ncbi:hypothetical protein AgCh_034127 [Apium graveolens]
MKEKPDEAKYDFSRKVVDILREENVDFKSFDILSDKEVRQGLKVYPQLYYIVGKIIGGFDIFLKMQKSGELTNVLVEKGLIEKQTIEDRYRI